MKREDLKKLELSDEAIDAIMALHGQSVQKSKDAFDALKVEAEGYKTQLAEAGKRIEGFKSLDIEGVKKQADDWKAKAEAAEKSAAEQVAKLKFDTALTGALASAKAKNPKAVQALLDHGALKYNDADGSIVGLKEQLEKIKAENDYLFEDETPAPKIVKGGNTQTVIMDPDVIAMRKAAGLPTGDK